MVVLDFVRVVMKRSKISPLPPEFSPGDEREFAYLSNPLMIRWKSYLVRKGHVTFSKGLQRGHTFGRV